MATLLSATLISYGRTMRQQKSIQDRTRAIKIANDLLEEWTSNGPLMQKIPEPLRFLSEKIDGTTNWSWKLTRLPPLPLGNHAQERFEANLLRLEIVKESELTKTDFEVLLTLDLVARMAPQSLSKFSIQPGSP